MRDTIVVGAGIVGLSVATHLARRGVEVTILDELPPASGASYGNAGFLVADTAMPTALPGMYKKVPYWLTDPEGPLKVDWRYLPRATPFLTGWLRASSIRRVRASSNAMRRLNNPTFEEWRALVGSQTFDALIRQTGQVYLWDGPGPFPTPIEDDLRDIFGVKSQELSQSEVRDLYPGISPTIGRALLIPGNGHTVSPGRLTQAVLKEFVNAGGKVAHERVQRIWPTSDQKWKVMTTGALHDANRVVIAAGAWSHRLLEGLGIRVPLESERGYHIELPNPSIELAIPILHKTGLFGANSMEAGLRLAGTVEIAGTDAPPDPRRCDILVRQVKQLFPSIEHGAPRYWMGHRPSVPDSVPVIGAVPAFPGLFACFGHGHYGLTGGPASGKLLARQILGEPTEFDVAPYSIKRFL